MMRLATAGTQIIAAQGCQHSQLHKLRSDVRSNLQPRGSRGIRINTILRININVLKVRSFDRISIINLLGLFLLFYFTHRPFSQKAASTADPSIKIHIPATSHWRPQHTSPSSYITKSKRVLHYLSPSPCRPCRLLPLCFRKTPLLNTSR